MPYSPIKFRTYSLSDDPDEIDAGHDYSEEIDEKIRWAHNTALKARPRDLQKLRHLAEKYPTIPEFKNFLVAFYKKRGQADKALALNQKIVADFPDYLFGLTVNRP